MKGVINNLPVKNEKILVNTSKHFKRVPEKEQVGALSFSRLTRHNKKREKFTGKMTNAVK